MNISGPAHHKDFSLRSYQSRDKKKLSICTALASNKNEQFFCTEAHKLLSVIVSCETCSIIMFENLEKKSVWALNICKNAITWVS
jgi:hypothetical protein